MPAPHTRSVRSVRSVRSALARGGLLLGLLAALLAPLDVGGLTRVSPASAAWSPPVNGFDWSTPPTFVKGGNGLREHHWHERTGTDGFYAQSYVNPGQQKINFNGCQTEEDYVRQLQNPQQPTVNTYEFLLGDGRRIVGQNCRIAVYFAEEAGYDVRLTVTRPDGSRIGQWLGQISVNNLLIVQLGDSYGSGEGAVDRNRAATGGAYGDWLDDRCHRSAYAATAQLAGRIEDADPYTSVTYLNFACSGATIDTHSFTACCGGIYPWDPYGDVDASKYEGTGVLGRYRGAQPPNPDDYSLGNYLPSQTAQLATALAGKGRQIDALFVSGGGNDAGFGNLAVACVAHNWCIDEDLKSFTQHDGTKDNLRKRVQADLATLPAKYAALADALQGFPIGRTFVTEYPDPGTEVVNDQVVECDKILDDVDPDFITFDLKVNGRDSHESPSELGYARSTFLGGLNQHLRDAAGLYGWTYVGGISDAFRGHGYCVGTPDQHHAQRYTQTMAMSEILQGPKDERGKQKGGLHPNHAGQSVIADVAHAQSWHYLLYQTAPDSGRHYFLEPPGPPTDVHAAPAPNRSMRVTFTSPPGLVETTYTASCQQWPTTPLPGQPPPPTYTATGSGSPVVVGGLTSGKNYVCKVRAENALGVSAWATAVDDDDDDWRNDGIYLPHPPTVSISQPGLVEHNGTRWVAATHHFDMAATGADAVRCSVTSGFRRTDVPCSLEEGGDVRLDPSRFERSHTLEVVVSNAAGEGRATSTFSVDRTSPPGTVTQTGNLAFRRPTFAFSFSDDQSGLSGVRCSVGRELYPCDESGVQLPDQPHGPGTLTVRVGDRVGNVTTVDTPFVVDAEAPQTTWATPGLTGPDLTGRARTFEFASSEPGSKFKCSVDLGPWTACGSPTTVPWKGGTRTFRVLAVDPAGNADRTPAVQRWIAPVDDKALARRGAWEVLQDPAYYRGSQLQATAHGSVLALGDVAPRRLSLVATTCPACGSVKVYLGSTLLSTVSLRTSTTAHRVVKHVAAWTTTQPAAQLRVIVASTGAPVRIDGVVVQDKPPTASP